MAKLTVSDTKSTPPDADFAITIDFKKVEESPTRVFSAATDLINAFEKIDQVLAGSVDSSIEPLVVLEDVEVGSLKTGLKMLLRHRMIKP